MFSKIFKQECRETAKIALIAFSATIGLNLIGELMLMSANSTLQSSGGFFGIFAPACVLMGFTVHLATRYYQTMIGQRAYFTHAIPAKSSTIMNAKLAWFSLLQFVVMALAIYCVGVHMSAWTVIRSEASQFLSYGERFAQIWQNIGYYFANLTYFEALFWVLTLIAGAIIPVIWTAAVVALSNHRVFNRMSESTGVLISIAVTYAANQVVSLAVVFLIPVYLKVETVNGALQQFDLVSGNLVDLVMSAEMSANGDLDISYFPIATPIFTVLLLAVGYWIARQMVTKHLNLR